MRLWGENNMERDSVLNRGQRLYLPYDNQMNVVISSDGNADFDIENLANNRTDKYMNCLNITKYLDKQQLCIRAIQASSPEIKVTYKNNGGKASVLIGDESIEINLGDSFISLKIDENFKTNIHIFSNDTVIASQDVEKEEKQNDELKDNQKTLKEQFNTLKKENESLVHQNEQLQQQLNDLKKQNDTLDQQIQQCEKDIQVLDELIKPKENQKDDLEKEFNAQMHHYDITVEIFEEYKQANKTEDIENSLNQIKEQLALVEKSLEEYIMARQKEIDRIHNLVRPQ